ncbi:hypothetical protein [Actinoplanes sichuanensis]|uniref:Uncharacterized protein n=1 Tax=Actinoplanes sichuanensis TaxID=512349 RepID=A0ABW4A009_9ACTN
MDRLCCHRPGYVEQIDDPPVADHHPATVGIERRDGVLAGSGDEANGVVTFPIQDGDAAFVVDPQLSTPGGVRETLPAGEQVRRPAVEHRRQFTPCGQRHLTLARPDRGMNGIIVGFARTDGEPCGHPSGGTDDVGAGCGWDAGSEPVGPHRDADVELVLQPRSDPPGFFGEILGNSQRAGDTEPLSRRDRDKYHVRPAPGFRWEALHLGEDPSAEIVDRVFVGRVAVQQGVSEPGQASRHVGCLGRGHLRPQQMLEHRRGPIAGAYRGGEMGNGVEAVRPVRQARPQSFGDRRDEGDTECAIGAAERREPQPRLQRGLGAREETQPGAPEKRLVDPQGQAHRFGEFADLGVSRQLVVDPVSFRCGHAEVPFESGRRRRREDVPTDQGG